MCAVCVSPELDAWPIFILCAAGVQRREGQLTETLRSRRLPFRVLETPRGASPVAGRARLHRRVWQQVCDDDLAGAILIEDGARLLPGFVRFLASGGHLHADLTQFCHGHARPWLWGGCEAAPGVALRPLAASSGLASGYALSRRGAGLLLEAAARQDDARAAVGDDARLALTADWPCDIARMDALVSRPRLVEPPEWLADAQPAEPSVASAAAARLPAEAGGRARADGIGRGWRDLVAATAPATAAGQLGGFGATPPAHEISPGF